MVLFFFKNPEITENEIMTIYIQRQKDEKLL